MALPALRVASVRQAVRRGAAWLLELFQPDGSLRGSPSLAGYYKGPCALAWSGHRDDARRMLRFAESRFLLPDGDLDGAGVPWLAQFRIYPHAWLACGAIELGCTETAAALVSYLERWWNPESGGFRARTDGTEEIMTTSMAGLACLRFGRLEIARSVAGWLSRMMEQQPDLRRGLYYARKPGEGLCDDLVDASKPKQWYFQYGISAAFLADYSRRTNDTAALELARRYLHASRWCREDVYRTPQSGKIGWGAAWTWALTRDPADLELAAAVADGLCALQCGDGSWNAEGVYEAAPAGAPETRMDVTAEFVALLAQIETVTNV